MVLAVLVVHAPHETAAQEHPLDPGARAPLSAASGRETPSADPRPAATMGPAQADRPSSWPRLQIADPVARYAGRKALDAAWERLGKPECAGLLTTFTDASGRILDMRLRSLGLDVQTYLTTILFIDGSRDQVCINGAFAFTTPGGRVVRLCVDALKDTGRENPEHAIAGFIHELLHTLGLTENPPSSAQITRRVVGACGKPSR